MNNKHCITLVTKDSAFTLGLFPKEIAEDIKEQVTSLNYGNGYIEKVIIVETKYSVTQS
jgi:hypothetical protein